MKKQIESAMKDTGERSFAKKLFLSKNKKAKKKKIMRMETLETLDSQKGNSYKDDLDENRKIVLNDNLLLGDN